jgi:hypothetical protein
MGKVCPRERKGGEGEKKFMAAHSAGGHSVRPETVKSLEAERL